MSNTSSRASRATRTAIGFQAPIAVGLMRLRRRLAVFLNIEWRRGAVDQTVPNSKLSNLPSKKQGRALGI